MKMLVLAGFSWSSPGERHAFHQGNDGIPLENTRGNAAVIEKQGRSMLFLFPSPWCSPGECRHSPGENRLSCSSPGEQHAKHKVFVSGKFQNLGIRADLESGRVRSPWCSPGEKHAVHQGKGRVPEVWFSPGENQFPLENTWLDVMLRKA